MNILNRFLFVFFVLSTFLVACLNDDQIFIEEPEVLFLEGEFIQLDSTGSPCDWFFKTDTRSYHLGNEYNQYFQVKSILTDTQKIVVRYESVSDQSLCNENMVQNTLANLELYEQRPIILSKEQYQEEETNGIFIDSAHVIGDYLIMDYETSGCQLYEWEPYLVESQEVLESFPTQRSLKLVTHEIGGCAAVKRKRGIFNLRDLKVNGDSIILNIAHGFGEVASVTYSY